MLRKLVNQIIRNLDLGAIAVRNDKISSLDGGKADKTDKLPAK